MSVFREASDAQILAMRSEAIAAGRQEAFDQALTADGRQIPTAPDLELARLHKNHGIEMDDVRPEQYSITWKNPDTVTAAEHIGALRWMANTKIPRGLASSLVLRVEEMAPGVAKLSDADRAQRVHDTQQAVGVEAYTSLLEKAQAMLQSGGDFKLSAAAAQLVTVDPYMLTTLATMQDAKTKLRAAVEAKKK